MVHGLQHILSKHPYQSANHANSAQPHNSVVRRSKKSLGQNFLTDSRIVSRILAVAKVCADDTVLEIGPGRGALTTHLAGVAGRLVAIELDEALAANLKDRYASTANVEIFHGDARELTVENLVGPGERYKLIANLPYYAATRIIWKFLTTNPRPTSLIVMVQLEVAKTIAADPGRMGLLSVMIQLYGVPKLAFSVPPRAFRPAPKVTSAVVHIDVLNSPVLSLDSEELFFRLVTAGFSAPRKQVHNSLANGLEIPVQSAKALLEKAGIEIMRRPGTLSVQEWGQIYLAWRDGQPRYPDNSVCAANADH